MTKTTIVLLCLLGLVLFAPASGFAAETQVDIPVPAFTLTNPCNGDVINFAADSIHANFHVDVTNGIAHVQIQENANLAGVATDGTQYHFIVQESAHENVDLDPVTNTGNLNVVITEKLVGQGPDNNLSVMITEHVTVNANGDVTVDRVDFDASCQ